MFLCQLDVKVDQVQPVCRTEPSGHQPLQLCLKTLLLHKLACRIGNVGLQRQFAISEGRFRDHQLTLRSRNRKSIAGHV